MSKVSWHQHRHHLPHYTYHRSSPSTDLEESTSDLKACSASLSTHMRLNASTQHSMINKISKDLLHLEFTILWLSGGVVRAQIVKCLWDQISTSLLICRCQVAKRSFRRYCQQLSSLLAHDQFLRGLWRNILWKAVHANDKVYAIYN